MAITKIESTRDCLRIWFFWQRPAIAILIIIIGLVMFYAYTATPKYQSTAKILVLPRTNQDLVMTAGEDQRQVIQKITQEDLNTEIDIIGSDKVLIDTILSFQDNSLGLRKKDRGIFDLIKDTIKGGLNWFFRTLGLKDSFSTPLQRETSLLKRSLNIFAYDATNIVEVSLLGEQPNQTKAVLESLLQKYIKHHNKVFTIDDRDKFYEEQASSYKQKLQVAEQDLKDFLKFANIVNLGQQNTANVALFTDLQRQLQDIEINYDEAKTRLDIFSNVLSGDDVLVTREMRIIPAIVELEKSIVPLLIRRSEISKNFTKVSREYKDINAQIAMLNDEIRNAVRKAIATDSLELTAMLAKKRSLKNGIKHIKNEAVTLQEKNRDLQELKRQVSFLKKNYLLYASKTENSRIYTEQKSQNIANVTIASAPSLPVNPVSPNKLLLLVLSSFFGIVSAITLPFILETMDQKLKTADDVEEGLGLSVVSSYPDQSVF